MFKHSQCSPDNITCQRIFTGFYLLIDKIIKITTQQNRCVSSHYLNFLQKRQFLVHLKLIFRFCPDSLAQFHSTMKAKIKSPQSTRSLPGFGNFEFCDNLLIRPELHLHFFYAGIIYILWIVVAFAFERQRKNPQRWQMNVVIIHE